MKRLVIGIGFVVLLVCAVMLGELIQSGFFCHCTDSANAILNNLSQINAAKAQWVTEHPGAKVAEFSQQDLSPYLKPDFWKRPVAGEIYLIHRPGEPAEALMTRSIKGIISAGMKLRFGPAGDVQLRPKTSPWWPNGAPDFYPAISAEPSAQEEK
ncbi:MAG: hypothetical protein WBW41_07490 [Verrucomicrobiia bacterium]